MADTFRPRKDALVEFGKATEHRWCRGPHRPSGAVRAFDATWHPVAPSSPSAVAWYRVCQACGYYVAEPWEPSSEAAQS